VFQTALAGGVSNISFSTLSADLGRTMYKYSFRLPPYYTLLVRSLSVLEGIALASDPNYKVSYQAWCSDAWPWRGLLHVRLSGSFLELSESAWLLFW
jgi:predicted unusual protein kinase regulating ubiquinone biosynthesis (AarF/ABC1/UbiB family)